jgi:putative addiction module component (TIGR02574 family)
MEAETQQPGGTEPDSRREQLSDRDTVLVNTMPPLSDEWRQEIKRRSAELEAGSVQTVPWEQIRADALRRIGMVDSSDPG